MTKITFTNSPWIAERIADILLDNADAIFNEEQSFEDLEDDIQRIRLSNALHELAAQLTTYAIQETTR